LRTILIIFVIGLAAFGTYGMGNTLITSGYNEIQTVQVVSAHPESLLAMDLGVGNSIDQVDLGFSGGNLFWSGRTVTVDIYDINGGLIGTGSVVANDATPSVSLSNKVTNAERPTLRQVTVTG
jgi:hypothetical protein